jgi:hypothetical protein
MLALHRFEYNFTMGWYFHAKGMRRKFRDETNRLVAERNDLQKIVGVPIKSSKKLN